MRVTTAVQSGRANCSEVPKIAIVSAHFYGASGYIEAVLAQVLSRTFNVQVLTSTTVTPRMPQDNQSNRGFDGYVVQRLPALLTLRGRVIAWGLSKALSTFDPDLIIQLSPSSFFSLPVTRWARRQRVPVIYISGENSKQLPESPVPRAIAHIYNQTVRRAIVKYAVAGADQVFGVTVETLRMIRASSPSSQPCLLNLPVDNSIYTFSPQVRAETRRANDWDGPVSVFFGKFEPRKRLGSVAEAWSAAYADAPSARLIFVGSSGSESDRLLSEQIRSVDSRIAVLPFCSPEDVSHHLQGADLAILPTPTVGIQQAMATGINVVLSPSPAVEHLLSMGEPSGVFALSLGRAPTIPNSARISASDITRLTRISRLPDPLSTIRNAILSLLTDSSPTKPDSV